MTGHNKSALINRTAVVMALLLLAVGLLSCVENQGQRSGARRLASVGQNGASAGNGNNNGSLAGAGSGGFGELVSNVTSNGKSELRHVVDPFDGTARKQVTIPKNFKGFFYLSGLNITALSNRLVSVRFSFGREMETITIPATVGRAAGLTPQTDIEVLILDMYNRPFENIRLLYDLYDYNDYRDASDGTTETKEPTKDPRSTGLYCRGLKLEHDPTFVRTSTNSKCDTKGEVCRYAYAKIRDNSIYQLSSPGDASSAYVTTDPTLPQLDFQGSGFTSDTVANKLKKCLPDNMTLGEFNANFGTSGIGSLGSGTGNGTPFQLEAGGASYRYKGPFRAIGESQWEISGGAIFFETTSGSGTGIGLNYPAGIFQHSLSNSLNANFGYGSFLFPRAGKMSINAEIDHFSSITPFGESAGSGSGAASRSLTSLVAAGDTAWMYGCNIRVTNYDSFTNEGIGSCNVSATIEVITEENGKEIVLATSTDVKLQLIRPSLTNYQGQEVLYQSMKTCTSSRSCGGNECCFNNRCWDRSLVSQCLDDVAIVGNRGVGEACVSDYECSSLCCNKATGACTVHTNIGSDPVLCSKGASEQCVAKEWCRKDNISDCYIVKTGVSPTGVQECALRCYNVPTHANCTDGICVPVVQPTPPPFNPTNPDCSTARDPLLSLPN
ncbi:MAG: hypothetical protein HYV97_00245 [Bdellovibrio sp.]|nr:hypothetical protein [Bdellovibrio sp.]